jgi:hypothetical protein
MKSNGKKTSSDNIGLIFLLKGQSHESKVFLDYEKVAISICTLTIFYIIYTVQYLR